MKVPHNFCWNIAVPILLTFVAVSSGIMAIMSPRGSLLQIGLATITGAAALTFKFLFYYIHKTDSN